MKHIELMREYMRLVEAGEKEPWKHFEIKPLGALEWIDFKAGHWFFNEFWEYRLKQKTININGFEVPEPEREPLKCDELYFLPSLASSFAWDFFTWNNTSFDNKLLKLGLIHKTKEAAIAHTKALLSFTKDS